MSLAHEVSAAQGRPTAAPATAGAALAGGVPATAGAATRASHRTRTQDTGGRVMDRRKGQPYNRLAFAICLALNAWPRYA
jgi:hypothetical protein